MVIWTENLQGSGKERAFHIHFITPPPKKYKITHGLGNDGAAE